MATQYSKQKVVPIQERASADNKVTERPKVKAVAVGRRKKKNVIQRLVVGLIGPDGLPAIGHYVSNSIFKPMLKDAAAKALSSSIQMLIYGSDAARSSSQYGGYRAPERPYRDDQRREYYRGYSTRKPDHKDTYIRPTAGRDARTDEIMFKDRQDCVDVLDTLMDQAEQYGAVSLADFYDASGVDSDFTDNNYGWTVDQIKQQAQIRLVDNGSYAIFMPKLITLTVSHDEDKNRRAF